MDFLRILDDFCLMEYLDASRLWIFDSTLSDISTLHQENHALKTKLIIVFAIVLLALLLFWVHEVDVKITCLQNFKLSM